MCIEHIYQAWYNPSRFSVSWRSLSCSFIKAASWILEIPHWRENVSWLPCWLGGLMGSVLFPRKRQDLVLTQCANRLIASCTTQYLWVENKAMGWNESNHYPLQWMWMEINLGWRCACRCCSHKLAGEINNSLNFEGLWMNHIHL